MKLTQLGTPPGVRDLSTLLDFLGNREAYESRLNKMEELREKLNEQIKDIGEVKNIQAAKQAAGSDRQKAKQELQQAQDKAKEMMADVDAAIEENERRSKELDSREAKIKKEEERLAAAEKKIDSEGAKIDALSRDLKRRTREQKDKNDRETAALRARAEKLKQAASAVV